MAATAATMTAKATTVLTTEVSKKGFKGLTTSTLCTIGTRDPSEILQYCYVNLVSEEDKDLFVRYNSEVNWYFKNLAETLSNKEGVKPQTKTCIVIFNMIDSEANTNLLNCTNWAKGLTTLSPKGIIHMWHDLVEAIAYNLGQRVTNSLDKTWTDNVQMRLKQMFNNLYNIANKIPDVNQGRVATVKLMLDISDCRKEYNIKESLPTKQRKSLRVKRTKLK